MGRSREGKEVKAEKTFSLGGDRQAGPFFASLVVCLLLVWLTDPPCRDEILRARDQLKFSVCHVESVRPVHLIYSRPCLRGGDGEGQGADLKQVHPSGFPYVMIHSSFDTLDSLPLPQSLINKQASVFEQVLARVRPWNQSSKIGALRIIEYDEHWRDILSMAIRPFDLALHGVVKHQHINEIDDNFDIPVMMFCRLNNHTVQAVSKNERAVPFLELKMPDCAKFPQETISSLLHTHIGTTQPVKSA
eukprot:748674-Hanusia_phi.AAC.1